MDGHFTFTLINSGNKYVSDEISNLYESFKFNTEENF